MRNRTKEALILTGVGAGALLAARAAVRRSRQDDLRGKTVLITGGSRGLGLVMARQLMREGARVAICARNEAELERASAGLVRPGVTVLSVPCDVPGRG